MPWNEDAARDVFDRNGQKGLTFGAPTRKAPASIPGAPALPELKRVTLAPGQWFEFTITGDPKAKGRPRRVKNEGQEAKVITPRGTEKWEKRVAAEALLAGCPRLLGPVEVDVWFYLGTRRRTDGDNLLKLVTDALNPKWKRDKLTKARVLARPGIAYEDDEQIIDGHFHKRIDKLNPRTIVRIRNPLTTPEIP